MSKQLGLSKSDDGITDLAGYINSYGLLNKNGAADKDKSNAETTQVPKILTNNPAFQNTSYYIANLKPTNKSSQISKEYGHVQYLSFYMGNQNMFNEEIKQDYAIKVEPIYNADKLNDHIILRGRARDGFNNDVPGGGFADNDQQTNNTVIWMGGYQNMSDGDENTGSTDDRSGNCNKQYVRAKYHNEINIRELQKITVDLEIPGLNTGLLRGDKIPVMYYEQHDKNTVANKVYSDFAETKEVPFLNMLYSGWFVITSLKFVYQPSERKAHANNYRTIVRVSRKEWVPPENIMPISEEQQADVQQHQQSGDSAWSKPPTDFSNPASYGGTTSADTTSGGSGSYGSSGPSGRTSNDPVTPNAGNIAPSNDPKDLIGRKGPFTTGIYSNNPLNLRKGVNWDGLKADQGYPSNGFAKFENIHYGYRAAFLNMKTQFNRGRRTYKDMISVWAPPTENDTTGYYNKVCSSLGVSPNDEIDFNDRDKMSKFAFAMSGVENGQNELNKNGITVSDAAKGYEMAFG